MLTYPMPYAFWRNNNQRARRFAREVKRTAHGFIPQ